MSSFSKSLAVELLAGYSQLLSVAFGSKLYIFRGLAARRIERVLGWFRWLAGWLALDGVEKERFTASDLPINFDFVAPSSRVCLDLLTFVQSGTSSEQTAFAEGARAPRVYDKKTFFQLFEIFALLLMEYTYLRELSAVCLLQIAHVLNWTCEYLANP